MTFSGISNSREYTPSGDDVGRLLRLNVNVSIQSDAGAAVIIDRIVFISLFLFYCLLLNHSFQTNPNSIYKSDDRSNVVVIIVKVHFLTFKIKKLRI